MYLYCSNKKYFSDKMFHSLNILCMQLSDFHIFYSLVCKRTSSMCSMIFYFELSSCNGRQLSFNDRMLTEASPLLFHSDNWLQGKYYNIEMIKISTLLNIIYIYIYILLIGFRYIYLLMLQLRAKCKMYKQILL